MIKLHGKTRKQRIFIRSCMNIIVKIYKKLQRIMLVQIKSILVHNLEQTLHAYTRNRQLRPTASLAARGPSQLSKKIKITRPLTITY